MLKQQKKLLKQLMLVVTRMKMTRPKRSKESMQSLLALMEFLWRETTLMWWTTSSSNMFANHSLISRSSFMRFEPTVTMLVKVNLKESSMRTRRSGPTKLLILSKLKLWSMITWSRETWESKPKTLTTQLTIRILKTPARPMSLLEVTKVTSIRWRVRRVLKSKRPKTLKKPTSLARRRKWRSQRLPSEEPSSLISFILIQNKTLFQPYFIIFFLFAFILYFKWWSWKYYNLCIILFSLNITILLII